MDKDCCERGCSGQHGALDADHKDYPDQRHDDFEDNETCRLVDSNHLSGHLHGPGCGHLMVPHGDHYDFLVGDRLHHVVNSMACCAKKCLSGLQINDTIDHGSVSLLNSLRGLHLPKESNVITTKMYAAGICCPSEIAIINNLLEPLPGITNVTITVVTKTVTVVHDAALTTPATLVATLNSARLDAVLGEKEALSGAQRWMPPWNIALCGALLAVSMLHYLRGPHTEALEYVALGAVLVGCPEVVLRAWASLKCYTLDINILMVIAAAGAVALQDYVEAATIVFIFGFAEWLESRCLSQAGAAVAAVLSLQPEVAYLASTNYAVPLADVQVGMEILVRPGERVPLDGTVVQGSSTLDESLLTGETRPVKKAKGDEVISGTVNCGGGTLRLLVTCTASDSTVSRLARVMEGAIAQKSRTDLLIERLARVYTPLVVLTAVMIAVVPSLVHQHEWRRWLYIALQVLVTACPCALVLSTPVVSACALTRCARRGVLLKGGRFLEALAALRTVTFDKTGTLTQGHFSVVETLLLSDRWEEVQLLAYAAALEQHSAHPLAPSIIGHAAARGAISTSLTAQNVQTIPGAGLAATIDTHTVIICSLQHAVASGCDAAAAARIADAIDAHGASACCILVDGTLAACLLLSDQPRPDAASVVQHLTAHDVHCYILSGDHPAVAEKLGQAVGLTPESCFGGLSPEQKLSAVHDLAALRHGTLAHVGDGINDAPALVAAHVGIAMGVGGSALAVEAADVALFTNNLTSLMFLHGISRRVWHMTLGNITFSLVIKAFVLVLIGLGRASLWIAVLADVGAALAVILHSLTILRYRSNSNLRTAAIKAARSFLQPRAWRRSACNKGCCSAAPGTEASQPLRSGCSTAHCGAGQCTTAKSCCGSSHHHSHTTTPQGCCPPHHQHTNSDARSCCPGKGHTSAPLCGQHQPDTHPDHLAVDLSSALRAQNPPSPPTSHRTRAPSATSRAPASLLAAPARRSSSAVRKKYLVTPDSLEAGLPLFTLPPPPQASPACHKPCCSSAGCSSPAPQLANSPAHTTSPSPPTAAPATPPPYSQQGHTSPQPVTRLPPAPGTKLCCSTSKQAAASCAEPLASPQTKIPHSPASNRSCAADCCDPPSQAPAAPPACVKGCCSTPAGASSSVKSCSHRYVAAGSVAAAGAASCTLPAQGGSPAKAKASGLWRSGSPQPHSHGHQT